MKVLKSQSGFTLIELVLVIVVLGILAAVAMVQFGTITDDSKKAAIDGAFGPYNAQLALAVNTLKKLPIDDDDTTAGSFKLEVFDKVTVTGGTVKAKLPAGGSCTDGTGCDWWVYVDDDGDSNCEAGEWKEMYRYVETTGAIGVQTAKATAGTC